MLRNGLDPDPYSGVFLIRIVCPLVTCITWLISIQKGPVMEIGLPKIEGGEDTDPVARERRDTVKQVSHLPPLWQRCENLQFFWKPRVFWTISMLMLSLVVKVWLGKLNQKQQPRIYKRKTFSLAHGVDKFWLSPFFSDILPNDPDPTGFGSTTLLIYLPGPEFLDDGARVEQLCAVCLGQEWAATPDQAGPLSIHIRLQRHGGHNR